MGEDIREIDLRARKLVNEKTREQRFERLRSTSDVRVDWDDGGGGGRGCDLVLL